ncbi:MAG TPA: glycosyltransferase [Trebonia sp.]|nr:glycosyltransferase [Trebonia sp.]
MTAAVTVDLSGGQMGGAARYRAELSSYLERRSPPGVSLIGASRRLSPAWLAAREAAAARHGRRIALNNVGFLTPGGQRWTLLVNALHFVAPSEAAALEPSLRTLMSRQSMIVHRAARRSDVLIAPTTSMAERIVTVLPDVANRLVVRMHPVSAIPLRPGKAGTLILCPVLFAPYKQMAERIGDWLAAVDDVLDDSVRLLVTASPAQVPAPLAASPRLHFVGSFSAAQIGALWARCRAVFFPTSLESFGCPLAEARVNGQPVIAVDSPQNREIAGPALRGYTLGDRDSLLHATEAALAADIAPDPAPFDPDAYFDWMLGADR